MQIKTLNYDSHEMLHTVTYRGDTICNNPVVLILEQPFSDFGSITLIIGTELPYFHLPIIDVHNFVKETGSRRLIDFCNHHLSKKETDNHE